MKRILITGTGGDVAAGIVKCVLAEMPQALLFSCDIKTIVPYLNRFEKHFIVPWYDDADYWYAIKKACLEAEITHYLPTTEAEILIADMHRDFFSDNNILLLINNKELLDIAMSKYRTAIFLRNNGICVPDTYLPGDLPERLEYPLIIKPDFGCGSSHLMRANNEEELKKALVTVPSPVIQKYVGTEEQEFTVGIFSDGSRTRSISYRRKLGRGSMSVYVEAVQDSRLDDIACAIARLFHLKGVCNIQLRFHQEQYYIFEINPRISSTVAFRHQMGFQDAIWWLHTLSGEPIKDFCNVKPGTIGIKVDSEQLFYPPFKTQDKNKPKMYDDVNLNEYGYYSLKKLPSDEERESYYKEKYYQEAKGSYEILYSDDELRFFEAKLEQKLLIINEHSTMPDSNLDKRSFLDIGCGEGFALNFFKKRNFDILGLDYSSAGAQKQNPDIVDSVMLGDIYDSINDLISKGKTFDVVNLDNLLEHVTEPKTLLQQIHSLIKDSGLAIIKVPNDFSYLQEYFWEHGIIKKPHWIAPLDHISYFNKDGLINVCKSAGLVCLDFLSDQLVEFSALNPNTNYFENRLVGKSCHLARVAQENILHSISPTKTIELYRVLGEMGIGREIIGVFRKSK